MSLFCREKLIRLELENKRLRSSSEQSEGAQLLQSMLDDVNARNNELQTEVRCAHSLKRLKLQDLYVFRSLLIIHC